MTLTIPLGPLAGTELTLWCTKHGRVWHGDYDCPGLKRRDRETVQVQPRRGSTADLRSPGPLHCLPPGPLANHLAAGQALIQFDARTESLTRELAKGKVDLAAFDLATIRLQHPSVTKAPLATVWRQCHERREDLLAALSAELKTRLPIIVAAAWLRTNKQSHQHIKAEKYAAFEGIAVREFAAVDHLTEWDVTSLTRRHVLPAFLDLVRAGEHPDSAATSVAAEQAGWARQAVQRHMAEFPNQFDADLLPAPDQVHEAWRRVTRLWTGALNGICTAHHGETFALFHEDQVPVPPSAVHHLFPCARIRTTKFTWIAGRVPAIFRLALQQRVHGLVGLEIDSAHARVYDENNAGLFLKNLLTLHDFPALAKHVEPAPSDPPRRPPVDTSDMDDYFTGFSNGLFGRGLNQPQCIYAAELAWRGQRLRPGKRVEPDREPEEPTIPVRNIPTEVVRLLKQGNPVELLSAVQLHVRREQLSAVREVVRTAGRLERDIQTALGNAWWMFGGEFAGEAVRRRMVDTIELDIPLLRPDGVLHVVELKRADVLTVRRHRNGLIVASAVHEAVGQVMNYLTLLDEQRGAVFEEFSIDTRRASATIVVGHPDFQDDLTAAEIHETLRIFNSHLSRVEVISYQQLVDRAERVLDLVAKPDGVPTA